MKAGFASIRKELAGIYSKPEIESLLFLMLEKLKGYSRTRFLLVQDTEFTDEDHFRLKEMVARLKNHEPIQYILGTTEFYGLPFYAVPEVLIPRPETEELVQWIIQENKMTAPTILDIGTGTGCIAISLQKNIPASIVLVCDISPVCIKTARRNAELNGATITILEYDILKQTPEIAFPKLDIVVSNPPYVRISEIERMEKNVLNFEPELALFVSDDRPLIFYEAIANFARQNLKNNGLLYFEINEAFGNECSAMLAGKGFSGIELRKDLNGRHRMIKAVFVGI
jgi:release factor glutamine methyltransferase